MVTLVTGAAGFLGSRVVSALQTEGDTVFGAGRPDVEIPSAAFDRLLSDSRPEVVIHCAGPASVAASIADPDSDRRGSVEVTRALVTALSRLDPAPRLVLVSSAAVYGQPQQLPVSEAAVPAPISPYGRNRLETERVALASGVPTTVMRVFSAYGEGLQRQLLWDIARQALEAGRVELWGDGSESRDFVHGDDVAGAVASVCANSRFDAEIVNVGTGRETTVSQIAQMLLESLESDAELRFRGDPREGDPLRWCADVTRLRALGWTPRIALPDGVARYARWARAMIG